MRSLLDSETELEVLLHFLHGSFRKFPHDCKVRERLAAEAYGQSWETVPPELLGEVIRRVGETSCGFPDGRNILACAAVCKRWREITKEIVRDWAPLGAGGIAFLSCLKRPGPHDLLLHCLVEWNSKTSTFHLYLSPSQAVCSLKCHSSSDGGGASPIPEKRTIHLNTKEKQPQLRLGSSSSGYTVLRNKAPLWNENMKCFTLNFHGQATMSSSRNFQLITPSDTIGSTGNQQGKETILLEFGTVREDIFTMDYGEPLSAS